MRLSKFNYRMAARNLVCVWRNRIRKISLQAFAIVAIFCVLVSVQKQSESSEKTTPMVIKGAFQSEPVIPRIFTGDLRDLPKAKIWRPGDPTYEARVHRRPQEMVPRTPQQSREGWRDPLLDHQERNAPLGAPMQGFTTPILNFAGQDYTGVVPPDIVGDIGANYYIQMVNHSNGSAVTIYDKTDGSIEAGPFNLADLCSGVGSACETGGGDPIVLYDHLAERWLMSEFADTGNHLCVYVSKTDDPVTGGWWIYGLPVPEFPDYPKYAVWPDAYYVSSHESSPAGYALERNKMLAGLAMTYQRFTATSLAGFGFQALIPCDLDGDVLPPVGSPNYFCRHRDDEVHNAPANNPNEDYLEIWEFHVDWDNSANSTFALATTIPVAEFDSDLCGTISSECFEQPGTTQELDPLREIVMWRLQYRYFACSHQTLVGNFVTDVNGRDHGGIRWFELRKAGVGGWTLFQEGTYAPDADHRWIGSIAMDGWGNMALGYSVSSATTFPSIRYVGRAKGDPLGTMTTGEATIIAGVGSQTGTGGNRWGDYSSMNVDPVDDCTFWYTNEYIPTNGNWRTRIASFRFPDLPCPLSCKMHWTQYPDSTETGWDVLATTCSYDTTVLADDWTCTETGGITHIIFWGSYETDEYIPIDSFRVRIYSDLPGPPFGRPDLLLWEKVIPGSAVDISQKDPYGNQGWFDPCLPMFTLTDHWFYYQYLITLDPGDYFWQNYGQIYWLSIKTYVADNVWGWKTTFLDLRHRDSAVYACIEDPTSANWAPLFDPFWYPDQGLDLAFCIKGGPEPPTAVHLTSFSALERDDYIEVEWTTATEFSNAGFNLYRSTNEDGIKTKLNQELIPAKGNELEGATYSFKDYDVAGSGSYYYWFEDVNLDGSIKMNGPAKATLEDMPKASGLAQNFPNPFNPITMIKYDLDKDCHVKLEIYNVLGQKVATLVDEYQTAGSKIARWNVIDSEFSSGIYFYKLQAGSFEETRKMVLLR